MSITLRSNQDEPVRLGIEFFLKQKNVVPSIIVAPTAFGKSIVIAKIAESVSENLLILQPSKELLEQNFKKYLLLGGMASIYSASFGSKKIGSVTYATIGSIKNLGLHFKNLGFTKMIIDEADRFPRESSSMLGKFMAESEITHVLGLTATPLKLQTNTDVNGNAFSKLVMLTSRSKKGQFFKEIIYVSQIQEMVDLKYWSKLEYEQYDIDDSGLVFNSTKADYTEESLLKVYETNRKSVLVFVPSVANAIALAARTPNAAAVYGDMPPKDREIVIDGFRKLNIRVIYNVNVLSVGFDHPELDCIICARPTASLSWLYQALGRGTRIAPGKEDCLIVDFSGNVKKFGKIENLYFKKENIWKLYGENGVLLTGIPMHEIGVHTENSQSEAKIIKMPYGKYKDMEISKIFIKDKSYLNWMLKEWTWNQYNMKIKKEIERLLAS